MTCPIERRRANERKYVIRIQFKPKGYDWTHSTIMFYPWLSDTEEEEAHTSFCLAGGFDYAKLARPDLCADGYKMSASYQRLKDAINSRASFAAIGRKGA